ncbi:hypothetical protein FB45DRAFT_832757 [Roridomyces roridus]|uniref:Uncharacterized protein n=1 Tax=Roridomyces roridus TaxID=1738132 RepID=A0AAD7BSZ9_9AGAR|nr:hypothetical protein FB45DRAFT_832757 [Roridomyces roridus]
MHRFFQISELVELLCSHAAVERPAEWETTKNPELAALAGTNSSVFFSHAIPLIWSSVTLDNLLRCCLPADCFDQEASPMRNFISKLEVLRPLRDEDFERILFYAPYIKFLSSFQDSVDRDSFSSGNSNSWFSRNKLPNLRGICWEDHLDDESPYLRDLLSPELTMIHFSYLSFNGFGDLYGLANICPRLKDVEFPTYNAPEPDWGLEEMNSAISECLRGLHFLETLVVHELDHEAFRHVSRIPSLRSLRVEKIPSSIPIPGQPFFPSLQTLQLISETDQLSRFLGRCTNIPLATFVASFHTLATQDETHRVFAAAASGISHTSMCSFSFYAGYQDPNAQPNHATQSIRASSLRQLFCFANMTSVTIQSVTGVDLDDATVEDMARSWPRIERLDLQSQFQFGNPTPRASVCCLRAFAKYCPNLGWLCMTFDAIVQKSLESLVVATSPIGVESAQPIAAFLASAFPSLKNVSIMPQGDPEEEYLINQWAIGYPNFRGWREVKSLLTKM